MPLPIMTMTVLYIWLFALPSYLSCPSRLCRSLATSVEIGDDLGDGDDDGDCGGSEITDAARAGLRNILCDVWCEQIAKRAKLR